MPSLERSQNNTQTAAGFFLPQRYGHNYFPDAQDAIWTSCIETSSNSSRVSSLKRILAARRYIMVTGADNGLTARVGEMMGWNGIWASGLTINLSHGRPDTDSTAEKRLGSIMEIARATTVPILVDGDNGGQPYEFAEMVKTLEKIGVSLIIIEDKTGEKKNSLLSGVTHTLEDISVFSEKILQGILAKQNPDFMIIARLEGLIAEMSMEETLLRARAFLEAGADGIMIHSKSESPDEVLEFARLYKGLPQSLTQRKVLVCVPTTYGDTITHEELAQAGFHIVIRANEYFRAAVKAIQETLDTIRREGKAPEITLPPEFERLLSKLY